MGLALTLAREPTFAAHAELIVDIGPVSTIANEFHGLEVIVKQAK